MTVMEDERTVAEDDDRDRRSVIQAVHAVHDALELPEGLKAEIIEGQLVIVPTANIQHARIVKRIARAIDASLPPDCETLTDITGEEPEGDRYVPDLGIWPVDVLEATPEGWLLETAALLLAVEVTSPGQEDRDYAKADGYARAGVPIYLLVDRKRQRCMLFTDPDPASSKYTTSHCTDFGKPLMIPLATQVRVETSEF